MGPVRVSVIQLSNNRLRYRPKIFHGESPLVIFLDHVDEFEGQRSKLQGLKT